MFYCSLWIYKNIIIETCQEDKQWLTKNTANENTNRHLLYILYESVCTDLCELGQVETQEIHKSISAQLK